MAGILLENKKRIQSVANTRKITKAMQLVAASKMKTFQKKAINTRMFSWDLLSVLQENMKHAAHHIFAEQRKTGPTVFVLYTSDKGLCGSLNQQLIKTLFQSDVWKNTPESDRLLITIGKKSYDMAKFNNIPIAKKFVHLNESMTPLDALDIIHQILEYWTEKKCKTIYMVAPHYKNAFTFYLQLKVFLPFSIENIQTHLGEQSTNNLHFSKNEFIYLEPNKTSVINFIMEELVHTLFLQAFYELKASEYSSRMIAMQGATDAADKIIGQLTLDLNKARQQIITQEISELIGGSEALVEQE